MEFALSEEQALIFDTARAFGADAIAPHAYDWEKEGTIPREVLRAAGELGFGALSPSMLWQRKGDGGKVETDEILTPVALVPYRTGSAKSIRSESEVIHEALRLPSRLPSPLLQ